MIATIVKILDISKNSYWNYKKQERPIISLLEKYFTKEELEEFLSTGKIENFELIKGISSKQNQLNQELINRMERLEKRVVELENSK
jgi:hypothetical protein